MIVASLRLIGVAVEAAALMVQSLISKNRSPSDGLPPLYLFGFSRWKTFMKEWFPERRVIFVPLRITRLEFALKWKKLILQDPRAGVMAWQYKGPEYLKTFCIEHGIDFHYVEDGFLRSVTLGALHTPPLSLTFDRQDMHFNASAPSDLESLLTTHDFEADAELMERARSVMSTLLSTRLSKYNTGLGADIHRIYGPKSRKRILVVGQVERDASIAYGCERRIRNNDLVRLARHENPEAQIIYKPHPEVLHGTAKALSNPEEVADISLVLRQDISLADAFETIDHVYTITSLSGFEALLRRIRVTTIGCPFYSGWGLTDDRQPNCRRTRQLTLEQVFAGAYILYAKYFDPITKRKIEVEEAIALLQSMKENAVISAAGAGASR